ncbi:ferrous iron transporter B [Aquabacterium sp. OR-4]|uniref:ferrous iron transporter B n=1 Tax=Aquabacterium sp. OR-4 TaxID=2978127 RepID=UPI0021B27F07|nr:ferrous iron transporter B [Aquabacterium sp. OR-4]MDT7836174.1 ferrous iron transporter B [Aquabacterium sp. OR-4]
MSQAASVSDRLPQSVALVGNPNCGKTALFNLLTGARQKVANYAGVTVERKIGQARLADGRQVQVIDLPGAYSLTPATPDEQVTLEVIEGRRPGERQPDAVVAVVDATNLRMNLRLVLELQRLGRPMMVALNMADVARARGLQIDTAALSLALGCPVVETVAVRRNGHAELLSRLQAWRLPQAADAAPVHAAAADPAALMARVREILAQAVHSAPGTHTADRLQLTLDRWVLHPVWGLAILAAVLFVVFQAVFAWAAAPMDLIEAGMAALGDWLGANMADGPLRSLLVDGAIAGAGAVLVFLPQILILFFFILVLEDSGYLPRAAFLLDNAMGKVGLSGRAFIPLLSSFACAVPGILATRTIAHWKDRLATIMVAPLMTCSARLPVYALLIGAFIPEQSVGPFNLQGLVLFALYLAGVASACLVAWIFKRVWLRSSYQPLMLELPPYRWPGLRNLGLGLWERARIFIERVGTIIFALSVLLWFLSTHPAPPEAAGATLPAIQYSFAGQLGRALEHVFAPVGFNWQICIALVPGMAAREVAVGALGTVYALSASDDAVAEALAPMIAAQWSLATSLALMAWFVFAPQCIATLATVKRETNGWRWPLVMTGYLFGLAYLAAFVTYRATLWLGG